MVYLFLKFDILYDFIIKKKTLFQDVEKGSVNFDFTSLLFNNNKAAFSCNDKIYDTFHYDVKFSYYLDLRLKKKRAIQGNERLFVM